MSDYMDKILSDCPHNDIEIVGIRDDLSAVYECSECGEEVRPGESDRKYRPKRGEP